jgi:hypothetical protein
VSGTQRPRAAGTRPARAASPTTTHFIKHVAGQESGGAPATYVLTSGFGDSGAWIIEIDPGGMVTHHEEVGFHVIGSGAPWRSRRALCWRISR